MDVVLLESPKSILCELKPSTTATEDVNNAAMTLILIYQCLLSQGRGNKSPPSIAVACMIGGYDGTWIKMDKLG